MAVHSRPGPPPDRLLYTRIYSTAQRLGHPPGPDVTQRAAAVAELQALGSGHEELLVEAAGVMLGAHPETSISHLAYVVPAGLLLEATGTTIGDETVRRWMEIGAERRSRGMRAHHHR